MRTRVGIFPYFSVIGFFYKMIYGELEATNYQFLLEEKTMDDAFGVCQ